MFNLLISSNLILHSCPYLCSFICSYVTASPLFHCTTASRQIPCLRKNSAPSVIPILDPYRCLERRNLLLGQSWRTPSPHANVACYQVCGASNILCLNSYFGHVTCLGRLRNPVGSFAGYKPSHINMFKRWTSKR